MSGARTMYSVMPRDGAFSFALTETEMQTDREMHTHTDTQRDIERETSTERDNERQRRSRLEPYACIHHR